MKRVIKFILVTILIAAVTFFFLVGKIADRRLNNSTPLPNFQITEKAKSLHSNLVVCDLQANNLLWDRGVLNRNSHGYVDIPRLIEGGYTLQVFNAVVHTPSDLNSTSNNSTSDRITLLAAANRWPIRTWFDRTERAIYQSQMLHDAANESSNLEIIKNKEDLNYLTMLRRANSYKVGGILSFEGLEALEEDINNIDRLYDAGYRIAGLVHFSDNAIGGSATGINKSGLTEFGRTVIRNLERRGVILDLAHASDQLITEVLNNTSVPILVSHTSAFGGEDISQGISDDQLRRIANRGGIIGIGFGLRNEKAINPAQIVQRISHATQIAGIEHVALGSNFDGAVEISFDASQIILITQSLLNEGFNDSEIKLIMGENVIRFLTENLPDK
ncbi:MAG: membrane dipeptidase [Cyclobacteriaceae bacterium]